jgi:hypothetical protein
MTKTKALEAPSQMALAGMALLTAIMVALLLLIPSQAG